MGNSSSTVCCSCYNDRLPTEEEKFIGIQSEIRERCKREKIPQPFQSYLCRKRSESEDSLSLHFLNSRRLDYLSKGNKSMNMSAILKIEEIPQIPDPSSGTLFKFQKRETRSVSLNKCRNKLSKFELFMSRQKRPVYPK